MSYSFRTELVPSGQAWIGELPKDWALHRLGKFFEARNEKVSDTEFPALSVTKNGIVPQLDTAAKTDAGDNRKRVCVGDFVINGRSDRKGSAGVSRLDGSVSLISIVLEPRGLHSQFVHNLLRSYPFQEEFYRFGKGIVADLWSTNYSEMKNIIIPVPSPAEQSVIANFLDRETAKIDTLIDQQGKLIKLLEEKRQAVISHAVTKGLNPDVRMKDSGIEWLGEVPEHWDISKLKFLGSSVIGLTYDPSQVTDESNGILVLRASNLQGGKVVSADNVFVNTTLPDRLVTRVGDILICSRSGSRALIGKNALIDEKWAGMSFGAFMMVFRSPCREYLHCVLNSKIFEYQSASFLTSTINQLTVGNLNGFEIPLPPEDERRLIVEHIRRRSEGFCLSIALAEQSLKLLLERRTALISAAVTGKIDVREAV
jgi:type I restriction enzyme S subunit